MDKYIYTYLVVINIIAFISIADDKRRAKRRLWRISELALIMLAYVGGGIGCFVGMYIFRHKIRKVKFLILIPLACVLYFFIWYFYFIFAIADL